MSLGKEESEKKGPWSWVIFYILAVAGAAVIVYWYNLAGLPIIERDPQNILELLMMMFVISFLCERTTEVFMTAGRAKTSEAYEAAMNGFPKDSGLYKNAKKTLEDYKSDTRLISLIFGFLAGMLISLSGLRILEYFINLEGIECGFHAAFFRGVDVVFTAGVISGGNDALHKCIKVITDVSEATSAEAKERKKIADNNTNGDQEEGPKKRRKK